MKKQQQWWLLFKVFSSSSSKTPPLMNSSSSSSSTSSYNIARPFCSTTTNTSRLFASVKKNLPLLIVPYQKIGYDGDGFLESKQSYNTVCDDTLGFTSLFDHDDDVDGDDLQKKKKKKALVHKFNLPEIGDRRICGSSEGWLVSVHANGEIQLLNPFSKVLVHLPPLTAFPQVVQTYDSEELADELVPKNTRGLCYLVDERRCIFGGARSSPTSQSFLMLGSHHFREVFLIKVVTNTTTTTTTSTDANSTTTVVPIPTWVMAIYGVAARKLAFCRPTGNGNGIDDEEEQNNNKWISFLEGDQGGWEDVTFYKGNFYAVSRFHGHVSVVKGLDGPSPFVENIIQVPYLDHTSMRYLVESSSSSSGGGGGGGGGDLLIVIRAAKFKADVEDEGTYRTIGFRVFKLNFNRRERPPSWVEVTNLGKDCALFVGHNHSFSFSASKFPGCRGNCIYFTDNQFGFMIHYFPKGGHDIGVYNLEDGSVEKLNYETSPSQLFMPPPIWYVPN